MLLELHRLIPAVLILGFHVKHLPFSNLPRLIICIFRPPKPATRTSREPRRNAQNT